MNKKERPGYENIIDKEVKKGDIRQFATPSSEFNTSLFPGKASTTSKIPNKIIDTNLDLNKNIEPVVKVKVLLISVNRVSIKPSNKVISTILIKFQNSVYIPKSNEWTIEVDNYLAVAAEMKKNKIVFEGIPPGTLSLCKKRLLNENIVLKGGIYDRLMKFQKEAVIFGLNRNGRVLLADDMGLGKTIQALAIATYYMVEFPMLIVAPASLLNNWKSSIADFMQTDSTIIGRREDFGNRISIISYNMAVTMIDTIKRCNYGVIIVDECHFLKSNTTKRTRLLLPILQNASRLIMISGTPATSRPVELHPIISALDKKAYPNFNIYGYRYCNGRKIGHFYDFRGSSNAGELAIALEHSFMIRRLKGLVLGQLPKKFRRQIILEGARKKRTGPTADVIGETVPATIMEEYVEAAKIKLEPVTKYLETIVEKDVKSVVFAHHSNMLDGIEVFCREKKVEYIRLDGSTPPSRRQQLVDQYQGDDKIRMAILSITACSTGLTLTAGKAVIFAELYWNPGTMLQAEDRIHRIGQKDSVDIHYLVMSTTVDEYVWPQLLKKLTVLENLGIGKNELKDVRGASSTDQQQCRIDDFISKRM